MKPNKQEKKQMIDNKVIKLCFPFGIKKDYYEF